MGRKKWASQGYGGVSFVFILFIKSAFILTANKSSYLKAWWTQEKTHHRFRLLFFGAKSGRKSWSGPSPTCIYKSGKKKIYFHLATLAMRRGLCSEAAYIGKVNCSISEKIHGYVFKLAIWWFWRNIIVLGATNFCCQFWAIH